jgi:hypothetical protein
MRKRYHHSQGKNKPALEKSCGDAAMFVYFYGFIASIDLNMILFSFGFLDENDDVIVCKRFS